MVQWPLVVLNCFLGALLHFLEANDRTELLVSYHSLTSCGHPVQLVTRFYWNCWVVRSQLTGNSESFISFLFLPIPLFFFCQAQKMYLSLWPCSLSSFPFLLPSISPALMLSLHHNFWPADDPERWLLFKTYAQQQQKSRGGVGWSGEMERWRSTRLTSSFLLLCSCIMHATAVHISRAFWTWCIYTHTQDGPFSLQSTTLYDVGECACLRGSHAICQVLWVAP